VREADRAVCIGPPPAVQSYLDAPRIIAAALDTGAQAIHPGYGFLSERAEFAEACATVDLAWIGPRAEAIRRMGSKIESKRLAQAAGVPCVPGYEGDDQSLERLLAEAQRIGFPLLIKASAGGGGKGMRRVDSAAELPIQLATAQSEAARAFGDSRVLLERLIGRPRHLEVQLAGDRHGGLIHLFERECSIQRNYQKVVEEAPASHMSVIVRERLYERALNLGNAISYDSLGTVEFILETGSDEPYFLEMNTRLQVEHTVTEQVTGLDLVELQIRVASGEALSVEQPKRPHGWAIEARVACEDPSDEFRPRPGAVRYYREPVLDGLRIDSGIDAQSSVPPHYDSLVAKLIGFGLSRETARHRLLRGLTGFEAVGIGTNQAFLIDLLTQEQFLTEPLHTGYLQACFGPCWNPPQVRIERAAVALAFAQLHAADDTSVSETDPWLRINGFRNLRGAGRTGYARFRIDSNANSMARYEVALEPNGDHWSVAIGEAVQSMRLSNIDGLHVEIAGERGESERFALCNDGRESWTVSQLGQCWNFHVQSALSAQAKVQGGNASRSNEVRAQMPGLVTRVYVVEGQIVRVGDPLLEMEAMKLILQLTAPTDGVVVGLNCKGGDTLSQHQRLLTIGLQSAIAGSEISA
jgi:3-methylcrotonyl-CoA carboxylase alpha subunit